ncbi:MAG TPA: acyl-CoA dehydratase activase-related protein, partial [Myxococcota bacterium]|nr:acyl-CoA dehydratase activase-related protein [Myxococcota bacterium]
NFQKEGYAKEELLAGLAMVLPKNVWQYVVQIPRMAELGRRFVLQGGTQHNLAAVKAQVDYIKERVPGAEVKVHPYPGVAGAHGAAMETLRVVRRKGQSTFIGLDATIGLEYASRNDESTRCHFCPNLCARTFIDTKTPSGSTARYISGFSCEKGTVESEDAMIALTRERKQIMKRFPNLVDYEAKLAFRQIVVPPELPAPEAERETVEVRKGWLERLIGSDLLQAKQRVKVKQGFRRSPPEAAARRKKLRIGIPRVLNLYSTAPLFRGYLEAVGIPTLNVVFSDYTSEEMWQEGGKYGSVDPCYPSKVAQAHIHNLLFHKHADDKKLDYIFFPCLTHVTSPLKKLMDTASCPIVAGSPAVIKAAFTKEVDFFGTRGIEYLNPALALNEPNLLKKQMFEAFEKHLRVTQDESDFAVDHGLACMRRFDEELEQKGRAILEQVEEDNRIAVLLLGRPYHNDPGLNHSVLEEFQVLGYPIVSMRSIPKDEAWLKRFFQSDLNKGRIESPLEITDVWPENYSTNSAQKVWAAKFAARHPNVVVLDLSSFKCGHDAPTYGLIDSIIRESQTPYSALHDIDANKPGGSIKIRVKTYAHSLSLYEEKLEDVAKKKEELKRLVEQKRQELQARQRSHLAGGAGASATPADHS